MNATSGHETPAYPGYATPVFTVRGSRWHVTAEPWQQDVGTVEPNLPTGWTAWDLSRAYVGLFPDKKAAGEALREARRIRGVVMSYEDELMPAIQQVTLERVKLGLNHRVGGTVRESMRSDVWVDMLSNELVYRLNAHVLAEKLPPVEVTRGTTVEFQSPASPFQHWKQKHAGSWWLRWFVGRWPVREDTTVKTATLTVDLTKYRSYPEANYALPELGAPVLIHTLSTDWGIR